MSSIEQGGGRRLIGAILLAFLVFLPLHYHAFTPTAQVAKECACVHGTRTQLLLYADLPIVAPVFLAIVLTARYVFTWTGDWSKQIKVRGPPLAPSIYLAK